MQSISLFTTKCNFIVLLQVNEIPTTVNKFHYPLIFSLTVKTIIYGKDFC